TEDDLAFMEHLAKHAAIAIENARLYEHVDERLQERVSQLTALQRTSREMNATLDRDHILQLVLDSAIDTTRATHGNVMLKDWDSGQFSLLAASGYSADEMTTIEENLLDPSRESIVLQVIDSGRARLIEDARQESCLVCVRLDTRSALSVPIFYTGTTVGLINLRHTKAGAFDMDDLTFLQALADQAAIAIGNARRFEEQIQSNIALRKYTDQLDGLLEIGRTLRTDVPLADTLEEIAYAIQETVEFDIVLISVIDNWERTEPMLRRAAAAGLPLEVFQAAQKTRQPLARYDKLLQEKYRRGPCYFLPFQEIDDWGRDLDLVISMPEVEQWAEGQWHSHDMLLAPLRGSGGRLLGHISVDGPQDGLRPSHRTLEALAIFAHQAAIAVENAKLYADVQRRADNLALLNEVSRALAQTLDPAELLDTVVKGVGLLLECDRGIVFQPDRMRDDLYAVASYGIDLATLADLRFAPGEGPVGQAAVSSSPLLIQDAAQEPGLNTWPFSIGSMMAVPIAAGPQAFGVLWAGCEASYGFTQADQALLRTLADQAAVALESSRLFASTQQAAMRLASLNELSRQVTSQLELQDILDATIHSLTLYLGYSSVGILLVNQETEELYVAAANQEFKDKVPPGYQQRIGTGPIGTAATSGETVLARDIDTGERQSQTREWSSVSSVSVPIKIAGAVAGVLEVEADRTDAFSEEDAAVLELVADQLANAIQNARLFQLSNRRVAELATINEIGRAISSALDADQLFELIFDQVSTLLDTRNFHIALYDPATESIHVKFLVEQGQRQKPVTLKMGQGLTSYLIAQGEPVMLNHGTSDFLAEHHLTLEREPAKSWLGVPMIAEDQVIGAMAIQSFGREGAFDAENLELLTTIAGQAAIAFHNATLFEERNQRITELSVLNQIAHAVSSTLELEDLLNVIYEQISLLMDTTSFFIALYDREKDHVSFPYVIDPNQREGEHPCDWDQDLVAQIIHTREPVLLPTGTAEPHRGVGGPADGGDCRSWLGVPMIAKDQVLGVIAVQSYDQAHVYDASHLSLLSTVSAQAAVAVRNAQLFRQVVRFGTELEEMVKARTRDLEQALAELTEERDRVQTLYRITSELGTSLELERVLDRALQLFADALDIQHGTITLLDQETGQLDVKATLHELHWRHRKGERTPLREGAGLAGWVLQNRKPTLVYDTREDSRWLEIPGRELVIRSAVAAPLSLGGGDILGVLTLGHTNAGHFSEDHLQMVTAAASQVAIAVNNSDLYAFITDQAERLGSMLQTQQAEGAKNQAILESIADGVLVLDHNGRVLLVNPAAEEMLGFSSMAIQGEHFRHMLGLGETPMHRDLIQDLHAHLRQRLEIAEKEPDRLQSSGIRLKSED
ncbi:MAG: GAF domain-containing protein, partial [Anaerolineae bacterium]